MKKSYWYLAGMAVLLSGALGSCVSKDKQVKESPDMDLFELAGPVKEVITTETVTDGSTNRFHTIVTTVRFDTKGRLVEKIYVGDSDTISCITIDYDKDGAIASVKDSKDPSARFKIERDEKGRISKISQKGMADFGDMFNEDTYTWDGNRVSSVENRGFEWAGTTLHTYADGELVKVVDESQEEGCVMRSTSDYKTTKRDKHNNWIERVSENTESYECYGDDTPEFKQYKVTETRTIKYY